MLLFVLVGFNKCSSQMLLHYKSKQMTLLSLSPPPLLLYCWHLECVGSAYKIIS